MEAYSIWSPYAEYINNPNTVSINLNGNYSTVEQSQVPVAHRDYSPDTAILHAPRHGGLYSGPPSNNPWNSIPVTATMTNMIQNNLRSANPPPGATEQYIGTERLGNNHVPMPGTYWHNPVEQQGQFNIKVRNNCESRTFDLNGNTITKNIPYTPLTSHTQLTPHVPIAPPKPFTQLTPLTPP